MKKLIHRYLNEYFYIKGDVIYGREESESHSNSFFFIGNLSFIFGLNRNELKWYVKSWIKTKSKSFEFSTWWTPVYKKYEYSSPNEWSVVRLQNHGRIGPQFSYIGGIDPAYVYSPYIPIVQTPQVFDRCDEFRNAFLNYYAE